MRARQRHLKSKSLAATAAYDARYITGISDGSVVSTWSDLSGNGKDATQSTNSLRPLYKTAIIGGQPTVRFDGTDDQFTHSAANSATCSIIAVISRVTSQTNYRGIFAYGPSTVSSQGTSFFISLVTSNKWGTFTATAGVGSPQPANTQIAATTPSILTMIDNDGSGGNFYLNALADGTWTGTSVGQGQDHLGGYNPGQSSNIDVGAFLLAPKFENPLRRRVEHSYGYSFKIACS
jgi:hypothetical protein